MCQGLRGGSVWCQCVLCARLQPFLPARRALPVAGEGEGASPRSGGSTSGGHVGQGLARKVRETWVCLWLFHCGPVPVGIGGVPPSAWGKVGAVPCQRSNHKGLAEPQGGVILEPGAKQGCKDRVTSLPGQFWAQRVCSCTSNTSHALEMR